MLQLLKCYLEILFLQQHFFLLISCTTQVWSLKSPFNLKVCFHDSIFCHSFILFVFILGSRKHWAVAVQVLGTSLVQQRGCNRNLRLSLSGKKLCHASCGITNFQMKRSIFYPSKTNCIKWYLFAMLMPRCLKADIMIVFVHDFYVLLFCKWLKDKCTSGRRDRW